MARNDLTVAEMVQRLHHLTRCQLRRAEAGSWEEVRALMSDRAPLMRSLADARPAALRPLRSLCMQIDRLNARLEDMIGEEQESTLRALSRVRRAERSIGAYSTGWVPRRPEYLDEKK